MKKEKILIDTSFASFKTSGIGVYVYTLIKCLKNNNIDYEEIDLGLPEKMKYKSIFLILWHNTILYLKTLFLRPKAIIFPSFYMPYFTVKGVNYYTVIHDLCHLREGEMSKYNIFIYKTMVHIALKKATTIVTVSNTIKQELIEQFNVNPERIKVVHNAIGDNFLADKNFDVLKKYGLEKNKYILSVATLNKRKNIPTLIKAFEMISDKYPEIKLILVGAMGNEAREVLTQHKNVVFTGYVHEDEIPSFYKNALLYVFPSLYEGFGTPIIEAQFTSCPLICSNLSVFREVAGEGAEYVDTNANSIAEKLEYLINNEQRRVELVRLGEKNVQRFSLENIEKQLLNVISE